SLRSGCKAFVGLAPGVLLSGLGFDLFFGSKGLYFVGSIFLGTCIGTSMGLSMDLLKDSWIEESTISFLKPQYILEMEEFSVGSDEQCDMTVSDIPGCHFVILDRDEFHVLEVQPNESPVIVSRERFRYHTLVEGDTIEIGNRTWIYHTRLAHIRDSLTEAVT
ncbi:hypothetical protein HYY75_10865, partial [bacterium]|nr:hypothetical protein [bacterium]